MPLTLKKRESGRAGKEKNKNGTVPTDPPANLTTAPTNSDDTHVSSQDSAKDTPSAEDPTDESMKSIVGRSKNHPKLDPESSSLGTIETGKEAKEREKNKAGSWMKTIGMRTLRLRKHGDSSKSGKSIQNILAAVESEAGSSGSNGATTATTTTAKTSTSSASTTIPPSPSVSSSITEDGGTSSTSTLKSRKHNVKKSASGTGTLNGLATAVNSSTPSTPTASGGDKTHPPEDSNNDKQDPARFAGDGMSFKAKLIGILEVSGPRGDRICQEALSELKMAVKAAGEHKQKITLHVALDGLRIRDEKTGDCLYHHQVHKISFIAQDLTDTRAFGYIFGSPDMGHRFFGIKTEKAASQVVMAMRDLFQVVFDMKKKEIERAKQQLEMQQKYLATRAATEHTAHKVEHKSSIAETYIEGACALGAAGDSSSGKSSAARAVPEVDLLNLEVELSSLQEGLENIHNNFSDSVPFRGSSASISSDPMNPNKFSTSSQGASGGGGGGGGGGNFGADPFGDSFDPFESGGFNQPQPTGATTASHHSSSMNFNSSDPFAQVDPFPTPKFSNLEESASSFFNTSADPFDTPVGNFSFNFPNNNANDSGSSGIHNDSSTSTDRIGFFNATGALVGNRFEMTQQQQQQQQHQQRSSSAMAEGMTSSDMTATSWQASFDDNFVPDASRSSMNGPKLSMDIFTELDPLGSGRVRPLVDRKDFFQHLKNPPRKTLKDLYPSDYPGSGNTSQDDSSLFPVATSSPKLSSKVQHHHHHPPPPPQNDNTANALSNSFSTNFNPPFDSAFKSAAHASAMASIHKTQQAQVITGLSSRSSLLENHSSTHHNNHNHTRRSQSPQDKSFTNNEYFVTTSKSTAPPPLLPPPNASSNAVGNASPSLSRANKKSPQLLKQMTIASGSPISPRTLPRNARLGKQTTVDSADEMMSPIPNLTPPPRPPHGTLNKTMTLSTAVPRPYSGDKSKSSASSTGASFALVRPFGAPEPPPRPLQTTMISSSISSSSTSSQKHHHHQQQQQQQQQQLPLVSPPPLPPKKTSLGPVLSSSNSRSSTTGSTKVLYTADMKQHKPEPKENDPPLPLPSRKTASYQSSTTSSNRYCVPPSMEPRYEFPETGDSENKVPKMTMEQALQQVASLSLGQLANRLELPVEKLSNFTIQQLAEKLTFIGLEDEQQQQTAKAQRNFGSTSQLSMRFESNFNSNFDNDNDMSTMSAPAGPAPKHPAAPTATDSSYDRYAVFRELAAEAASGFSLTGGDDNDVDSDDDRSRTQEKTLTGRDSSSERTLQVEPTACNNGGGDVSVSGGLSTMDDITDANLSDDQEDKFTLDDEAIDIGGKCDWATFESNFEDSFAPAPTCAPPPIPAPIKLEPPKNRPESPWDSDEDPDPATPSASAIVFDDDKILQSLPPDPEEFDFQPFEKPTPITPPSVQSASISGSGRRSSREKAQGFDSFNKLDAKSSPSSGQFKRQSSGSSKHSLSKYSDYSDSGRHRGGEERVRKNSRDLLESWDRRDWDRGDNTWDREWGDSGERWDRRGEAKDEDRRGREEWSERRNNEPSRSDSRGSRRKPPHGGNFRDSDEELPGVPSRRDGSLRRSGGGGGGSSRSRGSSARAAREVSRENLEVDDEEDEVDDDDRSYASYHSNYSSHSRRKHHRRHPPRHNHYSSSGPPRRHRRDFSPERYSNHESDFDDSYEEDSSRKRDYYDRDYYGKPSPGKYAGGRGDRRPLSGSKRSDPRGGYREYDRDYHPRDDRHYHRRDYHRAEEDNNHEEGGVGGGVGRTRDAGEPSDYSCEDAPPPPPPTHRSGGRRHRGRRSGSGRYYYTNSPSWDSESEREAGGGGGTEKRKLRFGTGSKPKDRAQSPRSTPKNLNHSNSNNNNNKSKSDYRFDDDFSGAGPDAEIGDSFDSFQSDRPKESDKSLPPQSPFEDNFVVQVNQQQQQSDGFDANIEFKRSAAHEEQFGTTGSTASGDVFFPAKFDVELEVEKETANMMMRPLDSSSSMTPIPTPSSGDLTRSSPAFLTGKRLESIRSEEERLESSEDGADVGNGGDEIDEDIEVDSVKINKEEEDEVSVKKKIVVEDETKPVLKKSDSFSIFNQDKDPFADDDFFK